MINILLSGCNGKMGQVITRVSKEYENINIVAGFDLNLSIQNHYPVYSKLDDINEEFDVIIDFSSPNAFSTILRYSTIRKIALVMATTGLSQGQINELKTASHNVPIFFTSNMSLGVNLLIDLVKKAAMVLEYNFDIEIIEKHHNQKVDAPSGTALMLANAINSVSKKNYDFIYDRHMQNTKRIKDEIGIHAVRGGTIVGDHTVIFAGDDEIIELNHKALSKNVFATGALNAASFLAKQKPGFYAMKDLIDSSK